MAILEPFEHNGVIYRVHFGRHDKEPREEEKLDSDELDALVLEENLYYSRRQKKYTPQGENITNEMIGRGKPAYYVEDPLLHREHGNIVLPSYWTMMGGYTAGAGLLTAAGIRATGRKLKKIFSRKKSIQPPPATKAPLWGRRRFLSKTSQAALGALVIGQLGDRVSAWDNPNTLISLELSDKNRVTLQEIDKLPDDDLAKYIARRNAVMAHGAIQVGEALKRKLGRKPVVGIVIGAGHFNITDYIRNAELRSQAMRRNKPLIRQIRGPRK